MEQIPADSTGCSLKPQRAEGGLLGNTTYGACGRQKEQPDGQKGELDATEEKAISPTRDSSAVQCCGDSNRAEDRKVAIGFGNTVAH